MTSTNSKHWSNIEEKGVLLGMRLLFWIYKIAGKYVFQAAMFPILTYYFLLHRTARVSSKEFLKNISVYTADTKIKYNIWWQYKHFWSFVNNMLDTLSVWIGKITTNDIVLHRREIIDELVEKKKGAFILTAHLGNLEVCRVMSQFFSDKKLTILVHTKNAVMFNQLLSEHTDQSGIELIEVSDIGPDLAANLHTKVRNGELVAMVADRTSVRHPERNTLVPFLGNPASFPQGPFILASLLKCPVITLFCLKHKNKYHVHFDQLADKIELPRNERLEKIKEYTEIFVDLLEKYSVIKPLQWFNFFPFWKV